MSTDSTDGKVTELPQPAKAPKGAKDILKQIENENKEKLSKAFKAKAQEIMDEINAADRTKKLAEKKLADLIARFEEGVPV